MTSAVMAAGAASALAAFGPGWMPRCPLHALTGLDCPGCGSTRAVDAILHLDLPAAVGYNLFAVLFALPALAWAWARTMRDRPLPVVLTAPAWTRWWAILAVTFTVARNLPLPGLRALAA